MSCRSYKCEEEEQKVEKMCGGSCGDTTENFNAGMPAYLGYSGYPGSEFPTQCGGGQGFGGRGQYGTYGGCDTQDHYDYESKGTGGAYSEYDEYEQVHEVGCSCMQCQTPYSIPYHTDPSTCGNPYCKCGDCIGDCKCGAQEAVVSASGMGGGHMSGKMFDIGLTNGNGLKGHLTIPFLNIHVDFNALLKYIIMILGVAAISYYLLGVRIRR